MNETPEQAARRLAEAAIKSGFEPQALHKYTDAQGNVLHWRIRAKRPSDGEKWIRPMVFKEGTYRLGEPQYENGKPLYRLHDLAARRNDAVLVAEGELCADKLAKLGLLATTSGAADSAGKADWSPLAGRIVTIWPDNDEAGQRYADAVENAVKPLGCTVRRIDVHALNLAPKRDVVDWLSMHPEATADDIKTLPVVTDAKAASPEAMPFENHKETIQNLATLSPIEYDRLRKATADALGVRPATLDKVVLAARKDENRGGMEFDDIDPWPEPIEPAELLTDIAATVRRFIVCQDETAHAVALWAAMSWFMEVVQVAPLAVITAPEKRCGKSQLLFLLNRLVRRPLTASNISPAALFRSIDAWRPTLLVDEADAFMRENEELRGLLNCGHTRDSAYIVRVVGDDHTPRKFNVWGAKALAGIGHLADTLMDRAVTLELRRKLPHERVDRLRYAEPGLFDELAAKLARFAENYSEAVRLARPELPPTLNDRAQDNWEALLAIAEVAGGHWPDLARKAALKLSGADSPTMSVGTELLADVKEVFETKRVDRITTADLLAALCDDDEKPWATYNRGKPMSPRQLARKLDGYEIKSKNLKIGYQDVKKGFVRDQFEEAWNRYLSPDPETIRYPLQPNSGAAYTVAHEKAVAATPTTCATANALWLKAGSGVADKQGETGTIVEVEI